MLSERVTVNTEEELGPGEYPEEELVQDSIDSILLNAQPDYPAESLPGTQAYGSVMSRNDLELLLSELFGNVKVDSFGTEWILRSPGATEDSVRESYQFLKSKDISDTKIATNAKLLGWDQETLWNNYRNLEEMGLNKTRIASHADLLGWDQETLWNNYHNLEEMGLNKEQIATNATLLSKNPKSIRSKYDLFVGLLRDDYADRNSGKEVILKKPGLLTSSRVTVESSTQFLYSLGLDAGKNSWLLGTTMKKKREKMTWMLREVFDYGEAPLEKKKDLIHSMHDMVRDRPNLLFRSVNYLEERKDELREKAVDYLK